MCWGYCGGLVLDSLGMAMDQVWWDGRSPNRPHPKRCTVLVQRWHSDGISYSIPTYREGWYSDGTATDSTVTAPSYALVIISTNTC